VEALEDFCRRCLHVPRLKIRHIQCPDQYPSLSPWTLGKALLRQKEGREVGRLELE
jgi:hypothetical protein